MKNGKVAGPDGIPAEALKADVNTSVEMLYSLFEIWEKEEIPAEWKKGYLIKIPTKGDLSHCDNYIGITLLSVPGKILNRIILERMKGKVDQTLHEQQAGFKQDRSCTDQIATLRIIGMLTVTIPLHSSHRLGHENSNQGEQNAGQHNRTGIDFRAGWVEKSTKGKQRS